MKINKVLLFAFLFLLIGNTVGAVSPPAPISKQQKHNYPKLIERILFQKIPNTDNGGGRRLLKKRKALAERYAASEEKLRDPVKKWFWNAFFFGLGGAFCLMLGAILSVKGEEENKDTMAYTGYGFVLLGILAMLWGFICGIIWLAKWMGA